ncbi:MAG: hypothetical protein LBG43_09355 [Treponema sp.]|nr:hypothetical protein [Treponema sp.]
MANKSNIFNAAKNQGTFLLAALLLVFTFFIFGPGDLYFGNAQELWFSITDILPIIVIAGIAAFTVLNVVYFVMPDKAKSFFAAFVWGIGVALYMQGNFLQIRYGLLDGQEIDWNAYAGYGVVNTIVWAVFIISPLTLCAFKSNVLKKIIVFSSCIIIAVQAVTLVFLGVTADTKKNNVVVTTEGMYTLSKNKNIIVFILDGFDTAYMNKILAMEGGEAFVRQFDGFTYYDNVVGYYPFTTPSIPFLLTGEAFKNETTFRGEYLESAFKKTMFYNILKQKNFISGIYTFSVLLPKKAVELTENVRLASVSIRDPVSFAVKLYQLVGQKYFPHFLKSIVWMFVVNFDSYKKLENKNEISYRWDDVGFNKNIIENGFKCIDNNVFHFYHLQGAHTPYTYNENVETIPEGQRGNAYRQVKGALQIVLNYISELKKNGLYDNTFISVMADHGWFFRPNPLFMIKDFGASNTFSISSIPITYANFIPMLEKRIMDDVSSEEFLQEASKNNNVRYFYSFADLYDDYLRDLKEVIFVDGKNDETHMKDTDVSFYNVPLPIITVDSYNNGVLPLSLFYSKFEQQNKNEYFISNGSAGHLMYGPYRRFEEGEHIFEIGYELIDIASLNGDAVGVADICANIGGNIIAKVAVNKSDFKDNILNLHIPVMLEKTTGEIEIRTFVQDGVILKIKHVKFLDVGAYAIRR